MLEENEIAFFKLSEMHEDLSITDELRTAVDTVVRSGRYILGPALDRFEVGFARYCGAAHCVGVGSGFDALVLSLQAFGIGPGDEVLVPAHTFVATWMAVSSVGATPVPVAPAAPLEGDLSRSCLLTATECRPHISSRTRAIIPVHLYGHPVYMPDVLALAEEYGLVVIEDAAQSHGATIEGEAACWGDAAAYSFYPGKNLGALGDGGAVVTNEGSVAKAVRELRNYGGRGKNEHTRLGRNSRLDEIQAAALTVKLDHLTVWNERRVRIAARYASGLADINAVTLPSVATWAGSVWHQYPVRSPQRDELIRGLRDLGIETGRHYPVAVQDTEAYSGMVVDGGDSLRAARAWADQGFSLPIGPHLEEAEVERVIHAVRLVAHRI
ncbi:MULTISPECIES: DegT/DnrJ/EryC1/StrS family aminotransferase [Auritidibacter]|uniref:DegT/DnrJ/EryC1/StrS family aminotransferase n=1 Tax=Auritidibacter ignavus TaxID=678932 RepID=A0AAJ6AMY6_9MICC|nr:MULTISPECIES: DegT/DnrJ/EryC1/StrS family aminotransferase [Auritidibacter]PXA78996.1 erythromycin biosynthesis sensory transduction protein eryC1 [Auritidibacter sp. NML120779]AXR73951.1 DegT/DnrJ/EryC1/StrS family aminotransferase [Auritidibacter sp. NML130574]WGH84464.1 DegT/DnrJ/EryC1/StrS family aminotransferase [Auritidibacter ignavus]WGH93788.1 DegT/DnrJ/EryC1/StrS family aminotransferase [Auritidibacter ignavus]WHS27395.1 DegT/DnrJ/EryC1/StrS family aminotransferase [Auritidibacter 